MRVRVIRLLEYTYRDQEEYEQDLKRWQVPPNGVSDFNGRCSIRSTATIAETLGPVFMSAGHTPSITEKVAGTYGVVCIECSQAAQDYVKCENLAELPIEVSNA